MAASNILKSAASSLTGAIEKAIIEIEDERNLAKADAVEVSEVTARAAVPAGLGAVSGKLGAAAAQAAQAASAAVDIASSVAGAVGVSGLAGAVDSFKESLSMELPKKMFVHCFICYYFLPFRRLSFHLAYIFLCCAEAFNFN